MRRSLFWLLDHYPETGESLASVHRVALEHAGLADQLGFDALWLAEHHFSTIGTAPNPAVMLAAISQHTERMRLGPAVSVLPLRNPIQVAEDYALVDLLSAGRLNMGVGAGSQALEFDAFGADFESRRRVFQENLDVLRRRWSSALAGERGSAALNVAPLQTPAPPLYVATNREDGARELGKHGDSLLTLVSPEVADLSEVAARVEAHSSALTEAGHEPDSAEAVVVVFTQVAHSEEAARSVAAPALGRLLQKLTGAAPPDPRAIVDLMAERGTGFFGTPTQAEQLIERYSELGVRHLAFVTRFGGMDADAAERSMRALAPI